MKKKIKLILRKMSLNIALCRAPSELCAEIQVCMCVCVCVCVSVGWMRWGGNGDYNKSIIKQNGKYDMLKYLTNFGSML